MKKTIILLIEIVNIILILVFIFQGQVLQPKRLSGVTALDELFTDLDSIKITKDELKKDVPVNIAITDDVSTILKNQGHLKEIDGGIYFNTSLGLPPCDSTSRGVLWFIKSSVNESDGLIICRKDSTENYMWSYLQMK